MTALHNQSKTSQENGYITLLHSESWGTVLTMNPNQAGA